MTAPTSSTDPRTLRLIRSDMHTQDVFDQLAPFETIGRYQLRHQLSEGGMGQVWLAHARHAHGDVEEALSPYPVALKFARLAKVLDDSVKVGMLAEGAIMARLSWGSIPKVYEIGEHEGLSYVAMEYIPGIALGELIRVLRAKDVPLPFDGVATIGWDAARTLEHVHSVDWGGEFQNLIHCDVSDRNFMISGTGRLVLIDFGIAKGPIETSHVSIKGTLRSMAPEHYRGEITPAVDAYGLGTILWSLIEGEPYRNVPHEQLVHMVATGYMPPLRRPGVPPALRAVCEGLLEPDPNHRMRIDEAIVMLEQNFVRSWSDLRAFVATIIGRASRRTGMTNDLPVITDDLRKTKRAARLLAPPVEELPDADIDPSGLVPAPPVESHILGPNGTSELESDRCPASAGELPEEATASWARADTVQPRPPVTTAPAPSVAPEVLPKVYGQTEELFPLEPGPQRDAPIARPTIQTERQPLAPTDRLDMMRVLGSAPPPTTSTQAPTTSTRLPTTSTRAPTTSTRLPRTSTRGDFPWATGLAAMVLAAGLTAALSWPSPKARERGDVVAASVGVPDLTRMNARQVLPMLRPSLAMPALVVEPPSPSVAPVAKTTPPPVSRKKDTPPPVLIQVDVIQHGDGVDWAEIMLGSKRIALKASTHKRLMIPSGTKRVRWRTRPDAPYTSAPTLALRPDHSYIVALSVKGPEYGEISPRATERMGDRSDGH